MDKLTSQIDETKVRKARIKRFLEQAKELKPHYSTYPEKMFTALVEKMIVRSKTHFTVIFKSGLAFEVKDSTYVDSSKHGRPNK